MTPIRLVVIEDKAMGVYEKFDERLPAKLLAVFVASSLEEITPEAVETIRTQRFHDPV